LDLILAGICVGLPWLLLFDRLRVDWSVNPQYSYGWVVPLLSTGLFWRRWTSRPAGAATAAATGARWLACALLLVLLPIRLIEEANPEWRLVLWLHAFVLVGASFAALSALGGRPWIRHFSFPVSFLLICVPWPTGIESAIIQNLMRFVAAATVEILGLMNIPALVHGNIIEVAPGLVGVDEACSGIRSLQTSLLVSLFLGEIYRLDFGRRALMVLVGFALAVAANVGRTFFLVWTVSRFGYQRMHHYHNGAGLAVVGTVLIGVWLLVLRMRPGLRAAGTPSAAALSLPFRRGIIIGIIAWLVIVEIATEAWYRAHDSARAENARWTIAWPTNESRFHDLEISDTALAMLRCTEARGAGWQDAEGNQWKLFCLQWKAGRNSAQLARSHRPEICLPGVGLKLVSQLGVYPVEASGALTLPFRQYLFQNAGRPLHIFYCAWEDRPPGTQQTLAEDGSPRSRLQAVLAGRRDLGQQIVEVAVAGPATPEAARELLRRHFPALVRI
jgi:exosortase